MNEIDFLTNYQPDATGFLLEPARDHLKCNIDITALSHNEGLAFCSDHQVYLWNEDTKPADIAITVVGNYNEFVADHPEVNDGDVVEREIALMESERDAKECAEIDDYQQERN